MSEFTPISRRSNKMILRPVVPTTFSFTKVGATALPSTWRGALWILITCTTFVFIQIPSLFYAKSDRAEKVKQIFALLGCVLSLLLFFAYLYSMWEDEDNVDLIEERRQRVHKFVSWSERNKNLIAAIDPITLFNLLDRDGDGYLDVEDLRLGFKTMGLNIDLAEAQTFFNMMDESTDDDDVHPAALSFPAHSLTQSQQPLLTRRLHSSIMHGVDINEFVAFVREFILHNDEKPVMFMYQEPLGSGTADLDVAAARVVQDDTGQDSNATQ
uniref:Calcium-binding mitochondrial carrier protein SCaMC-3 n=1 Tax=Lygus hesperus TaxID=30085 RepID=A0A0A9YRV2_LYGHE